MAGLLLLPTTYEWRGNDLVQETAPDGVVTHYNVVNGVLVSFVRGGETYTVQSDATLGHVRSVTDSNGTVLYTARYDAWGNVLAMTDNMPGGMPYRYVGALGVRWDGDLGLYYMRHRWYDPGLQQFMSTDPLKSNPDGYEYANDAPTGQVDPGGLRPWTWTQIIAMAFGTVVGNPAYTNRRYNIRIYSKTGTLIATSSHSRTIAEQQKYRSNRFATLMDGYTSPTNPQWGPGVSKIPPPPQDVVSLGATAEGFAKYAMWFDQKVVGAQEAVSNVLDTSSSRLLSYPRGKGWDYWPIDSMNGNCGGYSFSMMTGLPLGFLDQSKLAEIILAYGGRRLDSVGDARRGDYILHGGINNVGKYANTHGSYVYYYDSCRGAYTIGLDGQRGLYGGSLAAYAHANSASGGWEAAQAFRPAEDFVQQIRRHCKIEFY